MKDSVRLLVQQLGLELRLGSASGLESGLELGVRGLGEWSFRFRRVWAKGVGE